MLRALLWLALAVAACVAAAEPQLSDERVVFQTSYGDIEFAFLPEVGSTRVTQLRLHSLPASEGP